MKLYIKKTYSKDIDGMQLVTIEVYEREPSQPYELMWV